MQDTPPISVALCTYNGERFLRGQLDSLLAQDYPNFEIVAVDDASTDGTPAILQGYAARDPRVRVFRNTANLGFHRNFQEVMGRCRGELFAPCDQDDVWRPDKLRRLLAAIGDSAAAYCDSELIDENGRSLGQRVSHLLPMGRIDDPVALLFGNCVSGHAMLFRRSLLRRALPFPDGLFYDWWLAFAAAGAGGIAYCPDPLVQYRQHARAVTDLADLRSLRRRDRPRGHALALVESTERRLRAFAAFASRGGDGFCEELLHLWLGWRQQYLAPRLALFALRHRRRLFALRPHGQRGARRAWKLLWGLRLKQLVEPRAYGAPAAASEAPHGNPLRPNVK